MTDMEAAPPQWGGRDLDSWVVSSGDHGVGRLLDWVRYIVVQEV